MKKIGVLLIIIIATVSLLTGCKPKGDPLQTITAYYQYTKDENIEDAYNQFSNVTKINLPKADFIKLDDTNAQLFPLKAFKIQKLKEYKNKDIEGTNYKDVVEFNVVETQQDISANKEIIGSYKRSVVNDGGTWKVYREKENVKDEIAENSVLIAQLYSEGKGGQTKDLNQAVTILNEAIKNDKEYARLYYALGYDYSGLDRNDEAIATINIYLTKESDKTNKSDGYNLLGTVYSQKGNVSKAKESFNEALKLNPDNQYSKTNLDALK